MHDANITTSPDGLTIYEDDELVFDGAAQHAYTTVCDSAADIADAFTAAPGEEQRWLPGETIASAANPRCGTGAYGL